jgi:hypothetical protein
MENFMFKDYRSPGAHNVAVMAASGQEAYQELLDGFYEEYQDMIAPQQHRAAKDDPDYFLMLINRALYHEEQENVDKKGGQSLPYFNWKLFTQI